MTSSVALRYYLPLTVLDVAAQVRYVVVFDGAGGHLEPRVEVRVTPQVVPDRTARCGTTLDAGALESGSLGVHLTADGLIDAVGSHITGAVPAPIGPVLSPPGTTAMPPGTTGMPPGTTDAEISELAQRAAWTRPGSLRTAFDRSHRRTAALIADLSARAEQFLAGMRMGDGPAEVETFGSALAVVERELAAADRMRREWIAAQGFDVRSGRWDVDLGDAVTVVGSPQGELPDLLPADIPVPAGPAQILARDYGVLLAVVDPHRDDTTGVAPTGAKSVAPTGAARELDRVDEVLLRRPRPVTVVVYRRAPAGIGEAERFSVAGDSAATEAREAGWVRDDALTQHVEAVDGHSEIDTVAPQGRGGGEHALHLSFYPNGAIRSFGVSSTQVVVGPALTAAAGGAAELATNDVPSRTAVAAAALEAARLQLALLQASDEFTRLAATHAHGGELTTLEQDARFAALRSRLG
jgi:hypothetical protein